MTPDEMGIKEIIKLSQENTLLWRFIGDLFMYLNSKGRISVQSYNTIPESSHIFRMIRELQRDDKPFSEAKADITRTTESNP